MLAMKKDQMADWNAICKAFAKREGATLLFTNENSMGLEYPNGTFRHIYIEELANILK